jgi:hypothetical protein
MHLPSFRLALAALVVVALCVAPLSAADGLKKGTPDIKSAGPLAFAPEGILLVGDAAGAAIFAIDTGDKTPAKETGDLKVEKIDEKIANMLGTTTKDVLIRDVKVNPASGNVYVSASRGTGPNAAPVILRVTRAGKIEEVPLKDVGFAKATIPNASERQRTEAITHIAYANGKVIVAGLSNEEFASKLRTIPFPFSDADKGASVEIYHGAHGRFETNSPVRTFVPYDIKGETHVLAAYQCTPLVKFSMSQLKPGEKVKGTTVAELGNGNRPLDMIVYEKDGKDYLLIANNRRGVMKVTTEGIDKAEGITSKISGTAGQKYDTIKDLQGVEQLDKLDKARAIILVRAGDAFHLETIPLP